MTEKTMRRHLKKIWYRWDKLYDAVNDAHNDSLIQYPKDPSVETVCAAIWAARERIEKYTKDQIASIIQREVRSKI